jgi:hypothetical protein
MRWVVGGRAVTEQAASTNQMGRFETSAMTTPTNLTALADLSGQWIDRAQTRRARTVLVLDVDSSVSPTYGEQEGTRGRPVAPGPRRTCVRRRSDDRQPGDGGVMARCVGSLSARIWSRQARNRFSGGTA